MLEKEEANRVFLELVLEANRRALAARREADPLFPPTPADDPDEGGGP